MNMGEDSTDTKSLNVDGMPAMPWNPFNLVRLFLLRLSVQRELKNAVLQADKEIREAAVVGALKEIRKNNRRLGVKAKSLPSVLKNRQPTFSEKLVKWIAIIVIRVSKLRPSFVQNPIGRIFLLHEQFERQMRRITVCEGLISGSIAHEIDLKAKAQNARRAADSLKQRAARRKNRNNPLIKKAELAQEYALHAERTLASFVAKELVRRPIRQELLVSLEREVIIMLDKSKQYAADLEILKSIEDVDKLIEKSRRHALPASTMIDRVEGRVLAMEASIGNSSEFPASYFKLSDNFFSKMEEKVAVSKNAAAESDKKLAELPPLNIDSLDLKQLPVVASLFEQAYTEYSKSLEEFSKLATAMEASLSLMQGHAEVWKERKAKAEENGNMQLSLQAAQREQGFLEAVQNMTQFMTEHERGAKEIKERLDTLEFTLSKIKERLAAAETSSFTSGKNCS